MREQFFREESEPHREGGVGRKGREREHSCVIILLNKNTYQTAIHLEDEVSKSSRINLVNSISSLDFLVQIDQNPKFVLDLV